MEQHVTILGVLHIAWGALGLLTALILTVALLGAGVIAADPEAITVLTIVATSIGFALFLPSVPGLIGGIGVIKHHQWARIVLLVVGFLNLLLIPFGTILGIYTIWVLMHGDVKRMFESKALRGAAERL
ncbi:MAG: hypothetical protein PHQ19_07675 [Candidatus Krumholzibacteria bacterium]|nr:hypothetical protein [Candidatus Krumholzibacteria bacterium]